MSGATQKVVNFSELSAEEQSKYVDFLVQNDFVFNNDGKEEAFMATIKINPNQGISKIEQDTQVSHDKENTSVMNNNQLRNKKEVNELSGKREKLIEKMNKIGNNCTQNALKEKSKMIQKVKQPLQNITNCKNNLDLSVSSKQQPKEVAAINNRICQPAVNQEESSLQIEQKKQQILEKLQQKLKEANQLAEIEEASQQESETEQQKAQQQQSSYSKHETFQPSPQHHKMQINIQKSWKEASKIKRNPSNPTNPVSNSHSKANPDNLSNPNKTNKSQTTNTRSRSKNAQTKDEIKRTCRISQDLMEKNMKYITRLQEKQKECTSKERKRSVSPVLITPRSSQNAQVSRSSSSTPQGKQMNQKEQQQPPKQLHQNIPSTFEEVMKRQSHLINSVCQQMQNKTNKQNNLTKNISNNNGGISKQYEQYIEFNSFGNPNNHQNNQHYSQQGNNISNNSKQIVLDLDHGNKCQWQNIQTNNIPYEESQHFVHGNSEGRGNFNLQNKNNFNINRGVILTELRQLVDDNLGLTPQKVSLSWILCIIDELYQAKFIENTLVMRRNSQRDHGQGVSNSNSKLNEYRNNNDQRDNNKYQSNQTDSVQYELQFSEFIFEYFNQKYGFSKKQKCQNFMNLIFNIEWFLEDTNDSLYSPNHILGLRMFADFVQNNRTKEELIFYLFVREMLLKCTMPELNLENNIQETMNIQLSLEQCQQVLEQVYGKKEQKIIDRFMQRLGENVLQHSNTEMNIGAHFFLDIALEDYIEGKSNKIYESSEYHQQQSKGGQAKNQIQYQERQKEENETHMNKDSLRNQNKTENEEYNTYQQQYEDEDQEDNYNQLSSFEKLEYTFEQSFGDTDNYHSRKQQQQQSESQQQPQQLQKQLQQFFPFKKYECFTPQNELEQRIWDKMVHKIHAFLQLVIEDNQDSVNQCQLKFEAVEKIVTKKINKMLQCLMIGCKEQWLALLCITNPQIKHINHLNTLLTQLSSLRTKQSSEITSSQLSNFCKTVLQTKELSKAIGKLLLCIIMPDSQQININTQ